MELFNPHSNEWLLNKFEIYKTLQAMDTAYFSEQHNGYVITRYDDVKFVLKNHDIFSSARGNLIRESPYRFNRTLGASDDPVHGMLKDIVKESYSKNNIQRIVDCFVEKSNNLITETNHIFNLSEVVQEASAWASAEILNLPHDKTEIKNLVLGILQYSSWSVMYNTDQSHYIKFNELIINLLKNQVPSTGPGIYHEFITNSKDNTLLSLFSGPTISGAGSLAGSLGFLTLDIYRENLLDKLIKDPSLIENVVDESLRYNCSSGRKIRTVTKDVTLHNVQLKRGDKVIVSLEAANRDPIMFPDPDKFILGRDNAGDLSYGYGMHACIALAISRELLKSWVKVLIDSLGEYKVLTSPSQFVYQMTSSGNQDSITNLIIEKHNEICTQPVFNNQP